MAKQLPDDFREDHWPKGLYRPGGLSYRPYDWQRQTWYPFVMKMWEKYRDNLPPGPNGKTTPPAEATWK